MKKKMFRERKGFSSNFEFAQMIPNDSGDNEQVSSFGCHVTMSKVKVNSFHEQNFCYSIISWRWKAQKIQTFLE